MLYSLQYDWSCFIYQQLNLDKLACLIAKWTIFNIRIFRYAPATQLWRGRLHVMGGSKENRHTPGLDHWSLAVKDGKALEKQWRTEIPIPRGGPHRWAYYSDSCSFVSGQRVTLMFSFNYLLNLQQDIIVLFA
jgi:hypothetical protein